MIVIAIYKIMIPTLTGGLGVGYRPNSELKR